MYKLELPLLGFKSYKEQSDKLIAASEEITQKNTEFASIIWQIDNVVWDQVPEFISYKDKIYYTSYEYKQIDLWKIKADDIDKLLDDAIDKVEDKEDVQAELTVEEREEMKDVQYRVFITLTEYLSEAIIKWDAWYNRYMETVMLDEDNKTEHKILVEWKEVKEEVIEKAKAWAVKLKEDYWKKKINKMCK